MAKRTPSNVAQLGLAARKASRDQQVEAMRSGVVVRAHTYKDRKKDARRMACRGKVAY